MKTEAMLHQTLALNASYAKRNFAFLFEQGLGKTWAFLADSERLYQGKLIEAVVVIAPNGVHSNWVRRECPAHLEVPFISYYWKGNDKIKTKKGKAEWEKMFADHYPEGQVPLRIFTFNIDTVNTPAGYAHIEKVLKTYKCMMGVDESTRIKNHTAKRSIKVVELGRLATARRILSGTPLPRSPADLYMQFHFLKEGMLGTKSFRAFNAEFTVLLEAGDPEMQAILHSLGGKTFGIPQVAKKDEFGRPMYKNLEKLKRLMEPHCFRATKAEYLPNLPEKIYKFINFEMTAKQRAIYDELERELTYLMEYQGEKENVQFELIAARTKMKQVTSGYIIIDGEVELLPAEDNPRMKAFKDYIRGELEQEPDRKLIVWAIYKEEMKQLKEFFDGEGVKVAVYNGDTKQAERDFIIDDFQENTVAKGGLQVIIGQPQAMGIGLTLTAADWAVFFSVGYDNELRMQSEDRNHRIGTKNSVLYVDFVAEDSIDEEIHRNLSMKTSLAAHVLDGKPI